MCVCVFCHASNSCSNIPPQPKASLPKTKASVTKNRVLYCYVCVGFATEMTAPEVRIACNGRRGRMASTYAALRRPERFVTAKGRGRD